MPDGLLEARELADGLLVADGLLEARELADLEGAGEALEESEAERD